MPDHVDRIVQAWRRERPDLDLAALTLLGRLFRTAHLADAALAKPLAAHGLQPGWSNAAQTPTTAEAPS